MFQPDKDGIHATVAASAPRKWFAYSVMVLLGVLMIYTALIKPPAFIWLLFMVVFGGAVLVQAERLRRGSELVITLTDTEVRDSTGTVLARIDDIRSVERGAFALKPSNGFTMVLHTKKPRAWVPGLWWRMGRRVGVGGVTAAGQSKFMAEQIALRIKTGTVSRYFHLVLGDTSKVGQHATKSP